uniref:Uncharacterized protein n=1 Tax=Solanum lycopersicum TaxID=4081 RepID=A0A3Q7FHV3_SOLLC
MLAISTPLNIVSAGVDFVVIDRVKDLPIAVQTGANIGRGDKNVSKNMDDSISVTKQTGSQIDLHTCQQTEGFNNKSGSKMSKRKEIISKRCRRIEVKQRKIRILLRMIMRLLILRMNGIMIISLSMILRMMSLVLIILRVQT